VGDENPGDAGLHLPIYAVVGDLPVRVFAAGEDVDVEAWDPGSQSMKRSPRYLPIVLMGQDEDGPVEVERLGVDEWTERVQELRRRRR
jgi:hypothetical protein